MIVVISNKVFMRATAGVNSGHDQAPLGTIYALTLDQCPSLLGLLQDLEKCCRQYVDICKW